MSLFDRRFLVFTGLAGLAGGLATMVASSSCDVECLTDDRPSIAVRVYERDGSALRPVPATELTYTFRGLDDDGDAIEDAFAVAPIVQHGTCVDAECTRWEVGADRAGTFEVEVHACGKIERREVEVPLAADDCHAQTQRLNLEVDCDPPMRDPGPVACDMTALPSAIVYVGILRDDMVAPVEVDRVWYELEGRRAVEATCAFPDHEGLPCALWTAGWELPGTLTISTEWCDTIVSETVEVGMTDDGCHVDTQFVMLRASTRGCVTSSEPDNAPPQRTPWEPDALGIEPPRGDPPGPRRQYG